MEFSESLTNEEKIVHFETLEHIALVQKYMAILTKDLIDRSLEHDKSKMREGECKEYAEAIPELNKVEYQSKEYHKACETLEDGWQHHIKENRHHVEHHKNGIDDMTLVDLIEMLSDWKSATLRGVKKGDILNKSLPINSKKYNISPQLQSILKNTITEYLI